MSLTIHLLQLCRELLRFLYSLDRSGMILRAALSEGASQPLSRLGAYADVQRQRSGAALPPGYHPPGQDPSLPIRRTISSPTPLADYLVEPSERGVPRSPSMPKGADGMGGLGVLMGRMSIAPSQL